VSLIIARNGGIASPQTYFNWFSISRTPLYHPNDGINDRYHGMPVFLYAMGAQYSRKW